MKEAAERLSISARHLSLVDEICAQVDGEYRAEKDITAALPGYRAIADQLYAGQSGRQMVLGDVLTYILAGRGYWAAGHEEETFRSYLEVIMHVVNLVLIQESILSSRISERREFLQRLRAAGIQGFFASEAEEQLYERLVQSEDQVRPGDPLYKTMDSLLPKSAGVAIELLVFVYLLKRAIGYVLPLLFTQRIFRGAESFAPPDYLILRSGGQVIGVEVGGGLGIYGTPSRGKLQQVNRFVQDTSIPAVTASMPHMQYRCPTCSSWPLFCPEVIERVATSWGGDESHISCVDCPRYDDGRCEFILYKGQLEVGGDVRHYHYQHVRDMDYVVNRSLRSDADKRRKLVSYFPFVEGLERFPPR